MRAMLALACSSAWNRRLVVSLIVLSVALSTFLVMTLDRVRDDVHETFSQSVSGTDLVVGPRGGRLELLLYSVFRLGGASATMRWRSAEAVGSHRAVAWWVPLALGDSHEGFPVLATTPAYFEHFRYGRRQPLELADGTRFNAAFEAVLGADVAQALGHRVGQRITLSHGSGAIEAHDHGDKPLTIVGILRRTGTPVDRTVHIGMEAMEELHAGWVGGLRLPGMTAAPAAEPTTISAMLVGLKSRSDVFSVQRDIADFRAEPLMAILPGVVLDELWEVAGGTERALQVMTGFVALASLAGLVAVVLAGLEQRRRELAILRAIGAGPRHMLQLLFGEGLLIMLAGMALGLLAHWTSVVLLAGWVRTQFGISLTFSPFGPDELLLVAAILACGLFASLMPGWRAYRLSLADGLSPRI
jgi:putative ABC transport system permease protein